jgi:hypothetical protein
MQSKRKWLGHASVALIALVAIVPGADAQTADGPKANVAVRITPTRQSDRPGGSSVSSDFLAGESKRLNLTAGKGDDLCVTGVWAAEPGVVLGPESTSRIGAQEAAALYVWRFDVGMREVATDRIVLDLSWQRISRVAPRDSIKGKQHIILREGQSHPIDLIHGAENGDCMSVVVDIIASIYDDAALQGRTLEWDLWFTGGQSGSAHRALTSPHGESAAFQFDPLPASAVQPGVRPDGATIHVYGQLRGRARADGTIDVALTAIRLVNSGSPNLARVPRSLGPISNSGQKNFVIRPGEAIKIVLPPLSPSGTGRVQIQKDPITGEVTTKLVSRRPEPAGTPAANEMSITVQARVR